MTIDLNATNISWCKFKTPDADSSFPVIDDKHPAMLSVKQDLLSRFKEHTPLEIWDNGEGITYVYGYGL
jgi:hypothetical protein